MTFKQLLDWTNFGNWSNLNMLRLGISTKLLFVIGLVFILFTLALAFFISSTSFGNLTFIKQSELERTSRILASRITQMEENAILALLSFEQNEPISAELQLLTLLGPFYADPGSYFEPDFLNHTLIEEADKIYVFQAQLNLVQLLQSIQQINNFSSISYYHLAPFDLISDAQPTFAFGLDEDDIFLTQFNRKGNASDQFLYQIATNQFVAPKPDYFDISSAYSGTVYRFYEENNFTINPRVQPQKIFSKGWQGLTEPRSEIIIANGVPVLQTWYPITLLMPHPETWQEESVHVGIAVIEQELGVEALGLFANQLGLDVAFAKDNEVIVSSLNGVLNGELEDQETLSLNENSFNYAWETVSLADGTSDLQAVVLSPVAELEGITNNLQTQILTLALITIVLVSVIVYVSLQYLLNRPLTALMTGVNLISSGKLSYEVAVDSKDEMGQLAFSFNGMAKQLQDLINSLEQRVAARTHRLETVAELGEQLNTYLDVDQILTVLVEQVKSNFNYHRAQVYLVDEETKSLILAAAAGNNSDSSSAPGNKTLIPMGDSGLIAKAAQSGEIARLNELPTHNVLPPTITGKYLDTYMEMAVPITAEEKILGVLDVQKSEITGLDEGDANMLRSLANYVAVALSNARLFAELQHRATELIKAHQEAEEARRKAERANQAKSEFLSKVSHELRTPLNGILGYAQVLKDSDSLSDRQVRNLGVIEESGEHLLTLINDILDLAKIEAQKIELTYSDINLQRFLDNLVRIFQVRADQKGLYFIYELKPDVDHTVHVDEKHLRQILSNLLSNAIQFTQEGGINFKVLVSEIPNSEDSVLVHFEIADTGVGLKQEDITRIFAPFEQVGPVGEGTGLGLAISKHLAEMMGTQIQVESVPGEGSRFWFDLTILKVGTEKGLVQESSRKIIGYGGETRRILVVDDEKLNRDLIVDLLAPMDFDVFVAEDASEALNKVQAIRPHLILMDLKMPQLNGLEATSMLQQAVSSQASQLLRPIVIAHSASAFDTDREKSIEAGCDDFLPKPVKRDDLLKLLEAHLDLDWIYFDETPESTEDEEFETLLIPHEEEMLLLLDLAKSGKLRRIMRRAERLRLENEALVPFANRLTELAQSFQEKKLLIFIQSCIEK